MIVAAWTPSLPVPSATCETITGGKSGRPAEGASCCAGSPEIDDAIAAERPRAKQCALMSPSPIEVVQSYRASTRYNVRGRSLLCARLGGPQGRGGGT